MMSREAFEAWALRNTSLSSAHEMAWAAWQAALAQPQAEPVLWVPPEREGEFHHDHSSVTGYRNRMAGWMPLYATPQQAQPTPAVQPLQSQLDEARADADRRHQLLIIQHAEAVELWNALKDLSFECDGVTRCIAPSRETYNRTFAVLRRKNHLSPEALRGYGSSGLQQQSVQFADGIAAPGSADHG